MKNALLYRMGVGFAGAVSRPQDLTTEPAVLKTDAASAFVAYGLAGKYDGPNFVPLAAGDTADKIQGMFVRPYPTQSVPDKSYLLGAGFGFVGDILKRGYMVVNVGADASTITRGSPVYIRNANPTQTSPLGAVLAAAENTGTADKPQINTLVMPYAFFTGAGDADGNVEISYKI
ncbi:hypothetical protein GC087_21370 [Pantoea sp. JZ2]|uniref:structural cement protein Gp24 n=1 Tax=Pantoea sp. JZ2 TaxID=2654189 RepID=UPI002B46B490|nr:hypothetical protein [Pantoea sp. JZ2]WRH14967.1 hypothetical protein GC087_21370 [Pantoea sp. JZ2]